MFGEVAKGPVCPLLGILCVAFASQQVEKNTREKGERRKGFRGRERSWSKLRESLWRENARERSTAQREKDKARPTEKDKEIKK